MLDRTQTTPDTAKPLSSAEMQYDLVVVGAGVAGLNALYAATDYLPKNAPVLLIDQKSRAGGMWNTAYDYVRLHQPHPMFTVGDLKWAWRKPRDYLAARDEVRDHLASALDPISKSVALETRFGQTVASCREIKTDDGYIAQVTFHPNDSSENPQTVTAKRVIHAPGLNYREAAPLALSSDKVISIIPQDLKKTLASHPKSPVYVIGGGKTGMDTVLATLADNPDRKVILINGRGTHFLNRTEYIPTGLKRWTSGELVSRLFRDLAYSFNVENEEHAIRHFKSNYSTDPSAPDGVFLYGLQSQEEHQRILSGVHQTHRDYLTDVKDTPQGPSLVLRSGSELQVHPESIFVNCTGSFFRASELDEPVPYLSPGETVISINARDGFHFLTSVSGFFTVHLLYRGLLRGQGFYTLDHEALFRQNRNAWVGASAAQAYLNQVIAVQALPLMLLDRCGLDLDRWYPLPRRMAGLMRMKANARADIAHCSQLLDRVAERFGVKCDPLA